MNETAIVVRGILHPDGTLELAERPTLPTGDVEVTVRRVVADQPGRNTVPPESPWEFMQRSRAELEASGHRFRTKEEIDADLEEMRDWDGKLDEVHRLIEEDRRRDDSP